MTDAPARGIVLQPLLAGPPVVPTFTYALEIVLQPLLAGPPVVPTFTLLDIT